MVAGENAVLRGRGREVEAFDLAIAFDKKLALWSVLGDAAGVTMSAERREAMRVIEESEQRLRISELAQVLGRPIGAVRRMVWRMVKDGQLISYPDHTISAPVTPVAVVTGVTPVTPVTGVAVEGDGGEGATGGQERRGVTGVTGVTGGGVLHLRCLNCGTPLTTQRQEYGYCAACSQGALYDDEERF